MASQHTYHAQGYKPQVLEVLKTNADGSVDLGKDGVAIITGCVVGERETGSYSLPVAEEKSPDAPKAKGK
jgi:hypothetical protein